MQDVVIAAPKQAPVALTQILSWLGVVTAIRDGLVAQKVALPGVISDLITKLNGVAAGFQGGLTPPTSIENDLADVLVLAKAVENATGQGVIHTGVQDLIAAVTWSAAGIKNVQAGQFAPVASGHVGIDGANVPVCCAVFRTDQGAAATAAGFVEPAAGTVQVDASVVDALQAQLDAVNAKAPVLEQTIADKSAEIAHLQAQVNELTAKAAGSAGVVGPTEGSPGTPAQ